nr:hypothetical protein [Tanacetum cinerariifolium]
VPGKELSNGLIQIKNDLDLANCIAIGYENGKEATSGHESSVHLHVDEKDDGKIYFKRIYICFKAMIEGWSAGCRKVIGLDGCFLKSTCRGELLTAMGRDEEIRVYLMQRLHSMHNLAANFGDIITPSIRKEIERLKHSQRYWIVYPCGNNVFELPFSFLKNDPILSVSAWYSKKMWQNAYSYFIKPMGCSSMWPQTPEEPPLPPVLRKMPSRPRMLRIKHVTETVNVITRSGRMMTCQICWEKGHNKKDGGDADPSSAGPSVGDPSSAGPSVADPSFAGLSVADPSSAGPSVADSTGLGTHTITEDPIVADPTDDIPTQQSKTSDTAKIIKDAIATGRLKTAGLKRRCKSERIAKRAKAFQFGKDGAGSVELVSVIPHRHSEPVTTVGHVSIVSPKASKILYPGNTILADLKEQYIKSLKYHNKDNERTAGVRTDDSTMTNQRKEPSLETDEDFDTPMIGSGQAPLDAVPLNYVNPTKEMMRRGKWVITKSELMKSPFYVRVVNADKVENNEEKKLAVYLFSKMAGDVSDVLFETKYGQQSSRGQIVSLGPQEQVDHNVLSSWSAYLNFLEGKKDKNSSARLFLPTFEVVENAQTVETFMAYVENAHSTYGGRTKLDKADIHKKFGQYMLAINHGKAAEIIEAQLVCEKWKCGLDDEGKKQNTQLGRLRNKYAAKILRSDCNMYKSKILKAIKVPQHGK